MPTDMRTRLTGVVSGSPGCRRRRSSWDSTPPRLVEFDHTRVPEASSSASAAPSVAPATSIETIAPQPG